MAGVNKETGEEIIYQERHELFGMRIKYWGILYVVIGPIVFLAGLLGMKP